mgnify:CR=1 FL=1
MKHFTLRKLRPLALTLGLVLCFGLFAGCSSQDGEPSQDPSQVVSESPSPSVDPSDEPSDTTDNGTANNGTNGNDDTAGVNDVVGKVTAIDGNTATLQIYSAPEGAVIESYASVDMTQYSATEETDEVDLTAWLRTAPWTALTPARSPWATCCCCPMTRTPASCSRRSSIPRTAARRTPPDASQRTLSVSREGAADGRPLPAFFVLNGSPRPARPSIPSDFTDCSLHFREKWCKLSCPYENLSGRSYDGLHL